jgi:hypothetical protein
MASRSYLPRFCNNTQYHSIFSVPICISETRENEVRSMIYGYVRVSTQDQMELR